MIPQLCAWIEQTALSQAMVNTNWAVPLAQSIHILAISVLFASSAMLDLRLLQIIDHPLSIERMIRRFVPWIWGALVVLLISGLFMITAEPKRELLNTLFWTKMALIAVMIPITLVFQFSVSRNIDFWDMSSGRRNMARLLGVVSLLIWVAIIFCGRWIAYAGASE